MVQMRQLFGEEMKRALFDANLDLCIAGAPTDEQHFLHSHGQKRSVIAVIQPDRTVVAFELWGCPESERIAYANHVRDNG